MDAAVEDDRKDMVVKTNLQYQPKFLFFFPQSEKRARRTNRAEGKKERGGGEEKERVKKERKKKVLSIHIPKKNKLRLYSG